MKHRHKVLLAFNDPQLVGWIEEALERLKQDPRTALTGMDAAEKIEAERPDLIVIDALFSHRDWLLSILQSEPWMAEIPVLEFPANAHPPALSLPPRGGGPIPETILAVEGPELTPELLRRKPPIPDLPPAPDWNPNRIRTAMQELMRFLMRLHNLLAELDRQRCQRSKAREDDATAA